MSNVILLVEDDVAQAQLIQVTLEQRGFRVEHVQSGAEAILYLGMVRPMLMLLDHRLPDMSGLDLITSLEAGDHGPPPFIVITCVEDVRLVVDTMQLGALDYLLKDFEFLGRLPLAVERAVRAIETESRLKETELGLRQSVARLAKAQQIARMGSWQWSLSTGRMVFSAGLSKLLGIPAQTISQASLEEISGYLHPDDLGLVSEALANTVRSGRPLNIDCRLRLGEDIEMAVNAQAEVEFNAEGIAYLLSGTIVDITQRKRAETEIQQLAYYDHLTGLPNRTLLADRLSQAIVQANRDSRLVGVLFLDLDGFKGLNDTFGHAYGDRFLKVVAGRLVEVVRETDTVARIGGDEFVIVVTALSHEEDIGDIAGKILQALAQPVQLEKDKVEVAYTGSIGISVFPMDGEDTSTLLKHADIAMYNAKELGKNNYRFYAQQMNLKVVERHTMESGMRRALERREFSMYYQPQIDLRSGCLLGIEALIRWYHPKMGMVPNDEFIPLAEETGFICSIGEWVLKSACSDNKLWQEAGLGKFRVCVNLSAREFWQKNLVPLVVSVLKETGLEPGYLELEVTESAIMSNFDEAQRILAQLKKVGVAVSVDGFGTGYSSVNCLKRFSLNRLKIDRSFLRHSPVSKENAAITETIIAMGRSLGLKVMAVGVEDQVQLEFLKSLSCHEVQGNLVSHPLSAEDLSAVLMEKAANRQADNEAPGKTFHLCPEPEGGCGLPFNA